MSRTRAATRRTPSATRKPAFDRDVLEVIRIRRYHAFLRAIVGAQVRAAR